MISDTQIIIYIGILTLILILMFPAMEGAIVGAVAVAGIVELLLRQRRRRS